MTLPTHFLQDKYEILEKLREGGMGAIYKVRHLLLDDVRIVKVLRPHVADDPSIRHRFESEAKLAIRVRHPNVAQLFDYSVDDAGTALIVMEFIDGITLQELIANAPERSLGLTVQIACQGLMALSCLHRAGIVHRDVSSDNLMLTRGFDGEPQVKLIDLGIAKDPLSESTATATGVFLGKARYSAPEQFQEAGASALAPVSDIYSFGVLLYELLTGTLPIEGDSFASMVSGHVMRPPIPFEETDPGSRVPGPLRDVVLRALEKNPAERIRSADEFIEMIRPFAASGPELRSEFADVLGRVRAKLESGPRSDRRSAATEDMPVGRLETDLPVERPDHTVDARRRDGASERRESPPVEREGSRWPFAAVGGIGIVVVVVAAVVAWMLFSAGGTLSELKRLRQEVGALAAMPEGNLDELGAKQSETLRLIDALAAAESNAVGDEDLAVVDEVRKRLELEEQRTGRLYEIQDRLDLNAEVPEADLEALKRKELEYDLLRVQRITNFLRDHPNDPTGLRLQQEASREYERVRSRIDASQAREEP